MDTLSVWSMRLAEETAPDEIDLAPVMVAAFIEGGKAREELFYRAESGALGAFGAGEAVVFFPWILKGIAGASALILPLLSSLAASLSAAPTPSPSAVKDILDAIVDVFNIRDMATRKKKTAALPDNPYAPLKRALDALTKELQAAPIPQEQRDLIAYRVLYTLIQDPPGASTFVQKVAEAKDE